MNTTQIFSYLYDFFRTIPAINRELVEFIHINGIPFIYTDTNTYILYKVFLSLSQRFKKIFLCVHTLRGHTWLYIEDSVGRQKTLLYTFKAYKLKS